MPGQIYPDSNEGSLGFQAVSLTRRFQNQCRRQAMQSPKRIEPVENEQADYHSTQRKLPRLKSFDARIERRETLPVQIYLANLVAQRAREHTVTEDVSPHGARVLTNRCWQHG